ncbi:MAG TPA: RluA family pseudouridine synthase [Bacteroidota bacterium]|nr:RluA family pseudouridine synthase [Bacteroidota bacterium]
MPSREIHIDVPPGQSPERLDVYLTRHIENATRAKVQKAIRAGLVRIGGSEAKVSYRVSGGESIDITIPKPPPPDVEPENIPLEIVYEDDALLVVNKPAGMVTHPAFGHYTGTLVNALLHHAGAGLSAVNDRTRPGIVHRLDKDTSGLLLIAKNDTVHAHLAGQFSRRETEREYQAVVWGTFDGKKSGVIEAALGRSASDRKKIAVRSEGKPAVTTYRVVEEFGFLSLLSLKLLTGRTHQIRVHLHHIGHPVFGDPIYGGRRIAWGPTTPSRRDFVQRLLTIIGRQALHAKTLGFIHPVTGERKRFDSALPADMTELLAILRSGITS